MKYIKLLLSIFIVLTFLITPANAKSQFSDVPYQHWATEEIDFLLSKGIIRGFEDGTFRPNQAVTRADAAIMIAKALGLSLEGRTSNFKDVPNSFYAHDAIAAVAETGIIKGYNGNYSPRDPLTRSQMASILVRAFNLNENALPAIYIPFMDVQVNNIFHNDIQIIAKLGIAYANPFDSTQTYKPNNATTRAEFSTFLTRTLDSTFRIYNSNDINVSELEIHHLDVGQGDSTLIITPNNGTILIDAGTATAGQKVVQYLKQAGIDSIDRLVSTHAHADHIGGMLAVMQNFNVGQVLDSGIPHSSQTYLNYLQYIDDNDIPFRVPTAGERIGIDPSLDITIVNSGEERDSLNDSSIALHVKYNHFAYLTSGDAESAAEQRMVNRFNLKSDVLKVGHHGSNTSSNQFFLHEVQPKDAIISYGEGNSYGHPHSEVIDRLLNSGVENIYSTVGANVILKTNGQTYTIEASEGTSQPQPVPAPTEEEGYVLININTADFELLQEITGVGPTIAQRIIDYRETNGSFNNIEEIMNVSGIGQTRFEQMKDQITV